MTEKHLVSKFWDRAPMGLVKCVKADATPMPFTVGFADGGPRRGPPGGNKRGGPGDDGFKRRGVAVRVELQRQRRRREERRRRRREEGKRRVHLDDARKQTAVAQRVLLTGQTNTLKLQKYWVSQGNKWCDLCKIYISNNPFSIRTHELGKRHKDNVTQRLSTMQKDGAAKEKEQQQAARALQAIEAKAKKSYQKDLENNQRNVGGDTSAAPGEGWVFDSTSGYHYDKSTGLYYDSNSGFYYSDGLGKWVTQEEAYKSVDASKTDVGQSSTSQLKPPGGFGGSVPSIKGGKAPGLVVTKSLNPMRPIKGAPSAISVNKRKREDKKPKVVSKEEEAALRAREAARKRVEDREKPLMGLYKTY